MIKMKIRKWSIWSRNRRRKIKTFTNLLVKTICPNILYGLNSTSCMAMVSSSKHWLLLIMDNILLVLVKARCNSIVRYLYGKLKLLKWFNS